MGAKRMVGFILCKGGYGMSKYGCCLLGDEANEFQKERKEQAERKRVNDTKVKGRGVVVGWSRAPGVKEEWQ